MPIYHGTLYDMFFKELGIARASVVPELWEQGGEHSVWVKYRGPDCAPFDLYVRFAKNYITLSHIYAVGGPADKVVRKGRMPKILDAMSQVCLNVRVESVTNEFLETYLVGVGFLPYDPHPGTFYKVYP